MGDHQHLQWYPALIREVTPGAASAVKEEEGGDAADARVLLERLSVHLRASWERQANGAFCGLASARAVLCCAAASSAAGDASSAVASAMRVPSQAELFASLVARGDVRDRRRGLALGTVAALLRRLGGADEEAAMSRAEDDDDDDDDTDDASGDGAGADAVRELVTSDKGEEDSSPAPPDTLRLLRRVRQRAARPGAEAASRRILERDLRAVAGGTHGVVVVNFWRRCPRGRAPTGTTEAQALSADGSVHSGGHIACLGPHDAESGRVLVLEPNAARFGWHTIDLENLIGLMSRPDRSAGGTPRGWLRVDFAAPHSPSQPAADAIDNAVDA